ncbi:GNAT family N-acetyltransferase [Rothia sp. AR01]|uniref:GNAT family N-acetyltransferase n=1 Tax=Rothia santali TaxID=2949643 RepID=A0A9X2HMA3_9MICC|nr:GNAT family N-acetyltransferase [Rothia santali]MCP3426958.1 GNAT family N-acetyltransferase [Rothia santali]
MEHERLDVEIVDHGFLTRAHLSHLGRLFDAEYRHTHGAWTPHRPYGYSPADVHVLVYRDADLLGHAGFQQRTIAVGHRTVHVAGTGGVLITEAARGTGIGRILLLHTHRAMRETPRVEFGYLGCREGVVPFYESEGWHRIAAAERSLSRATGRQVYVPAGAPIMILPVTRGVAEWPRGVVDLRGTPW